MKIEEVIKQLESILDHTHSMAASPDADEIWKEDSDALEFAITALRSVSREQVEKVWRGEWIHAMPMLGSGDEEIRCSECGNIVGFETDFCPHCGAPMTDEAVQMVMERLEAMKDGSTTD